MKVLCAGGGSGGHVTPVLAVINELSRADRSLEVVFVCDKAFESQSRGLMKHALVPVPVHIISAGKLRRYAGVPMWKQLLDIPTGLLNIRDSFFILVGFLQSLFLLRKFKPDVVFAKGGYVCLPLGYAAKLLSIPIIIHDSDARPGLTNRLLSRHADGIATGSPLENYPYPKSKTVYTGVPINPAFHPFTAEEQQQAKHSVGFKSPNKPLIVVTGGGLGAASINEGVLQVAKNLIEAGYAIYHITGKKHYDAVKGKAYEHPEYQLVSFVYNDMAQVLGAADVVVSRGSATFLQELAALAKPTIIIPASHLGDQVKNAIVYKNAEAAIVLTDDEVASGVPLLEAIEELLNNPEKTAVMTHQFSSFARPNAATDVAQLILEHAKTRADNS